MSSLIAPSVASFGDRIKPLIMGHALTSFRSMLVGPAVESGTGFVRLLTREQHPFCNFVCLADGQERANVRAALDPLLHCGASSALMFCSEVGPGAAEELANSGFKSEAELSAMAVDLDQLSSTTLPPGYQFARTNSPQERDAWADVFGRGYGFPPLGSAAFAAVIGTQSSPAAALQYFWILKDGEPVCTSAMCLADGVAGIYGVATVTEARGRGLGAFATAEPLRIARALGYRVGVLQGTKAGYSVYRKLGFTDFGEIPLYVRMAS